MPKIGAQKQMLLNQIKSRPEAARKEQLMRLLNQYEDLDLNDFKDIISDVLYNDLEDSMRNPEEKALWEQINNANLDLAEGIRLVIEQGTTYVNKFPNAPKIQEARNKLDEARRLEPFIKERADWAKVQNLPTNTPQEIQDAQRKVSEFMLQFPSGIHYQDAQTEMATLKKKLAEIMEQRDWDMLERGNYNALKTYKDKHPMSAHLDELDDLMWLNTKNVMNYHTLSRYLGDWPTGRHSAEANQALTESGEWEEVKRSGDLFRVDDYRDTHPTSPYVNEVNALYFKLRDEEMAKMKENPSEFSKDYVEKLISADIFTKWQLEDEGLVTDESWEMLQLDRNLFPNIQDYMIEDPNVEAVPGCTDIYLFGTPGTGKTCLLMGLTGANGQGYTLNMKTQGGAYAAALQEYVNAGITPGQTFGKFVTTINGEVIEQGKRDDIYHKINLVEMSGEEFALRIADNREVSLANMGTGATNLLRNPNRKVFFIIVDGTKDKVKVEYVEQVKDAEGNVIDERIRKKYISQLTILNKFVSLFELPENEEIMKRVDAIHFVVTKADMLGNPQERRIKARDLLLNSYSGPVEQLKKYCRKTRRINYSTDYKPQVFTFSLGQFFLGDVFEFDKTESIQIIDTIRTVTYAIKPISFWGRLKDVLG